MADRMFIDTEGIRQLAIDLSGVSHWVILEIEATTARAAATTVRAARNIAAGYPGDPTTSDSGGVTRQAIANSVHAERRAYREYRVVAGGDDIPLAGIWELGNKGRDESDPTFRHPLFGDRQAWFEQPKWPFLRMALDSEQAGILADYGITVDRAFRKFRL